jgi:hypothetical protein
MFVRGWLNAMFHDWKNSSEAEQAMVVTAAIGLTTMAFWLVA